MNTCWHCPNPWDECSDCHYKKQKKVYTSQKIEVNGQPESLGVHYVPAQFGTYVLYMPVKMPGSGIQLPDGLGDYHRIINECLKHYPETRFDKYVYFSLETSWVKKGTPQKRPGWHCDGFLTEDYNYIWSSCHPTVFSKTKFNVTPNHTDSLKEFEEQAKDKDCYTFDPGTLICLTSDVVHRSVIPQHDTQRTFVKISISKDQYNLQGNTHNPKFDYEWTMHPRNVIRNSPQYAQADHIYGQS